MERSLVRTENGTHVITVGLKCNNYCKMCYNPKLMQFNPSFEEIIKDIDNIKKSDEIYITGGEPTLRKDLLKIIKHINVNLEGSRVNLISNGRMFYYKDYAKMFKKVRINKIVTELHGSTSKIHDDITQVKGSFDQTLKGIKNIIDQGMNIEIRVIVNKINFKDLPNIANFMINNIPKKVVQITIFPINLIGDAYKFKEEIAPRYNEIKRYIETAVDILKDKFNIKLLHYPYCLIDKKYWKYLGGVSTSENRLGLSDKCEKCSKKEICAKLWRTYLVNFGDGEIEPIIEE